MAAVLTPPHLHPGLFRLPGVAGRRPARSHHRPQAGHHSPIGASTRRVAVVPTAATYRRRRAMALLLLVTVGFVGQLVVASAVAHTWDPSSAAPAGTATATDIAPSATLSGEARPPAILVASAPMGAPSVYVVRPGDTLWSIAQRLQPDADPRPLVDALAERAGSSALRPGQRIDLDGLAL